MNETLGIRYGKILAEVTGMDTKEIWEYLIDFVLWGAPDPDNMISYRLFWAWKAIAMMKAGEGLHLAGQSDGWAAPDSIAAEVLGWEYKYLLDSMPKSDQLTVTYSADTWIASAVYQTVEKFIKQSDVPYLEDVPKYPIIGAWFWYVTNSLPAYVVDIKDDKNVEILVPVAAIAQNFAKLIHHGAVLDEYPRYTTSWSHIFVRLDELSTLQLDTGELPY